MIDHALLPSFVAIFARLGLKPPRRGRTCCPLCNSDNPSTFSCSEEEALFHCFKCGAKGDKIDFVIGILTTDFKGALAWLGLSGCGFGLSSEVRKSQAAYRKRRLGLDAWTRKKGRELRKDFL